jgi:TetR/AcrR family tetracycline transcriptional repressor
VDVNPRRIGTLKKSASERRDLSRDRIISVAETIMDQEGEAAVNMRRVAQECGVTAMAIYHHVASKEELLTLVVDRVIGDVLEAAPEVDEWRASMSSFALALRDGLLANRGAASVFLRRPILSPNLAFATERIFEVLERGGIDGRPAAEAADAVVLLLMGSIANDLTRPPEVRRRLSDDEWTGSTPRLTRQIEDYAVRDGEQRFLLALDWLLDGIERASAAA